MLWPGRRSAILDMMVAFKKKEQSPGQCSGFFDGFLCSGK
jgi:hypothetical protein